VFYSLVKRDIRAKRRRRVVHVYVTFNQMHANGHILIDMFSSFLYHAKHNMSSSLLELLKPYLNMNQFSHFS
jgi:hypothetical protein